MARAGGEGRGPFVPVGTTNRDKRLPFCPGWCLKPGQKAPVPPLARLAVGLGTKATYCPGSKGCRDKWPGTKAYSVVVNLGLQNNSMTGGLRCFSPCHPQARAWYIWAFDFVKFGRHFQDSNSECGSAMETTHTCVSTHQFPHKLLMDTS